MLLHPATMKQLEELETIQRETGLLGRALLRAWRQRQQSQEQSPHGPAYDETIVTNNPRHSFSGRGER